MLDLRTKGRFVSIIVKEALLRIKEGRVKIEKKTTAKIRNSPFLNGARRIWILAVFLGPIGVTFQVLGVRLFVLP